MAKTIIGEDGKKYKMKKPFYKRVWFWILVVVAVIIISSIAGNSGDNSKTEKNNNEKEVAKTYKIGNSFKIGKIQYKINSVEVKKEVGPSILSTKAKDTFVVVNATVKNLSDEKIMLDSSFFKLKQGKKTYEADATASISANQQEDGNIANSMLMEDINPDIETTGNIVFDVTEKLANSKGLDLEIQTGFWGTQTGLVNIK